ncbi:MAG TPA: NUDIX hydrolase [Candidatus Limnocylindria bacterium]|nr:NUDIX hydrolase [Candidatus Limnocylindria bacterium]
MATVHLVVSALVRRDGRLLLVLQRGPGDPRPTWMLPGGVVEGGETVLDALGRELGEETGLELTASPQLAFAVHVIDDVDAYLALTFACSASGELAPSDPDGHVRDAAWVEPSDALERLGQVGWYDAGPLRRYLAGASGELAIVDRR